MTTLTASGDDDTVDSVLADYRAQIVASRDILAAGDLDARCALPSGRTC